MGRAWTAAACALALLALPCSAVGQPGRTTAESRIDDLIGRMTLDEKLGQLVQMPGGRQRTPNSRINDDERERVRSGRVGSYINVAGARESRELQRIAVEESRLGIPLIFAMDVIHGYRTIFPVPLAMAASWDPDVLEKSSRVAAVEATASGLHWTFTPMVDIARDPRWGRIVEGAGEDPFLGSAMAVAQVRGLQGDDLAARDTILATAKHFAAYGAAVGGRDYSSADVSERTLHEVYLPPFYAAAKAGVGSMMTSFNDIGGVPVTANADLVRGILRNQWGYQGLVISDWMAVDELRNHAVAETGAEAAALALAASIDMDMSSNLFATELKAKVEADPALVPLVDEAVRRVLAAKARLGLFDDPYRYSDAKREGRSMLTAEHRAAAREAARRSIVRLKNEGNLLPLAGDARRIAVVGALAEDDNSQLGSWRARGDVEQVKGFLPALREALPRGSEVVFRPGAGPRSDDASGIADAVEAAGMSDLTILVVGEDFDLSGEARSRSDIRLPGAQQALADAVLDTGKPVVVLLMNGRPLAIPELAERAPAILETWFLGLEAGPAIVDILLGHTTPGGKLPITFPRATGSVPIYYNYLPSGRPADPDLAKDTARYMDLPITPLFPFGHGLSYATFEYGELRVSHSSIPADGLVEVSIDIRNIGRVPAEEVVQLYVRDPVASVSRPVQELRGFRRVSLVPGETKRVTFTMSPAQFAIWSGGGWQIEPGRIDLMVGSSSADIRARSSFEIASAGASAAPAPAIPTPTREEIVR